MMTIGINLQRKDASVVLDLDPAFRLAVPVLKTAWAIQGNSYPVVTSGSEKTAKHSAKSAHYQGRAIDLRISNLGWTPGSVGFVFGVETFALKLSGALEECCGPEWYVVLEKDHIHLEVSTGIPNIRGWVKGKNFYAQGEG